MRGCISAVVDCCFSGVSSVEYHEVLKCDCIFRFIY